MTTGKRRITYTIAETGRALGVPPAAVREAIARGMIRATILGKEIRVPAEEVERILVNAARHAEDR